MSEDISNGIVNLMKRDMRRDFTIPEIMNELGTRSREKVVTALARLEGKNIIEIPREKGRTKYFRLKGGS